METLNELIRSIDGVVWGIPLIVLILACGVLLTVRLGLVQARRLGTALRFMVQNEEGDPSVVKKGHVLKVVDWADVAKDGSRQYAIVNAAEFNYQHMPLNSIGRFPDTGVKILSQDARRRAR